MGTRHLVAAVIDGDFKIAQYGQWDGYPSGQGATVYDFIHDNDLEAFKPKLRKLRWATEKEIKKVNATKDWTKVYPHLSRDAGAGVLQMVMDSEKSLFMHDSRGFAGDSLFCEFAYVLDFDNGYLEVYKGFNETPTPASSRFPSGAEWLEKTEGYEPISLIATFNFNDLKGAVPKEDFIRLLENACGMYEDEDDEVAPEPAVDPDQEHLKSLPGFAAF